MIYRNDDEVMGWPVPTLVLQRFPLRDIDARYDNDECE